MFYNDVHAATIAFYDTIHLSVWEAALLDSQSPWFWPLCLCSSDIREDALDCSLLDLSQPRRSLTVTRHQGQANVAMLSAVQEWRHSLLRLTQPPWREALSVSSSVMWCYSMTAVDPLHCMPLKYATSHRAPCGLPKHPIWPSMLG